VLYTGQDRHKPVMYVKMRTTRETPTASPGNQTTTQPADRSITLSSSKRVAVGLSGKSTGQPSACTRVTADQGKADATLQSLSRSLSLNALNCLSGTCVAWRMSLVGIADQKCSGG
jgi:hypothetical protein